MITMYLRRPIADPDDAMSQIDATITVKEGKQYCAPLQIA